MPSDTRSRLLHSALWRFYRDGFRNVGLDQIYDEVGISKTAFYMHFESKDELMVAVLDAQTSHMQDQLRDAIAKRGGDDPVQRLLAVFDLVEHYAEEPGFKGCIFVNAAIEFSLLHEPEHRAALRNKEAIEAVVRETAQAAGAPDPGVLARELCLVMDGAYVTRHVTARADTVATARRIAERVIRDHLAAKGRSSPLR